MSYLDELYTSQRFPRRGWWRLRWQLFIKIFIPRKTKIKRIEAFAEELERQHREKWEATEEQQAIFDRLAARRIKLFDAGVAPADMKVTMTQAEIDILEPYLKRTNPVPGCTATDIAFAYGMAVEVIQSINGPRSRMVICDDTNFPADPEDRKKLIDSIHEVAKILDEQPVPMTGRHMRGSVEAIRQATGKTFEPGEYETEGGGSIVVWE